MAKIVDLQGYRAKALEQRAFGPWRKRFDESYGRQARLADLSDKTLYVLALPSDASSHAFYEFIMGILELGTAAQFHYLGNRDQMLVVDIHLFLADQVRFEMMRRLGWLSSFYSERFSLLEMVHRFEDLKAACRQNPPQLAPSHPDYEAYNRLTARDREVFIRRLLQQALATFEKGLEE